MEKTSPVDLVKNKYADGEWVVIQTPPDTINDLITQRGDQLHFIQIITTETADNKRFQGLCQNTFIQNAFSNGARPIYAHVRSPRVTFEDINSRARVLVNKKRKCKQ